MLKRSEGLNSRLSRENRHHRPELEDDLRSEV